MFFQDPIDDFCRELSKAVKSNYVLYRTVIKRHPDKLHVNGELSFMVKKFRQYFLDTHNALTRNHVDYDRFIREELSDVIEQSKEWALRIKNIKAWHGHIQIFLDHRVGIDMGINSVIENIARLRNRLETVKASVICDLVDVDPDSLIALRLKYVTKVVENLYTISEDCEILKPTIFITSKTTRDAPEGTLKFVVGPLKDLGTGKKPTYTAEEFLRRRHDEIDLVARHKYGLTGPIYQKWKTFVETVGESGVKFELLSIKPKGVATINYVSSSNCSSRGAAFVLYNCARIDSILSTFNEEVQAGKYPPLPEMDKVNFNLLTLKEEWNIIFSFMLNYPTVLRNSVTLYGSNIDFRSSAICHFLSSFVLLLSKYYTKTKILTEPREHLLPVMYARLHFISIIGDMLKSYLAILDITSVPEM